MTASAPAPAGLLELPGGTFVMGSDEQRYPDDGENPSRPVHVDGFGIAAHTVSNEDFAGFVEATSYVTTAEREGWSFVFGGLLPDDFPSTRGVAAAPWWRQVYEADWRRPEGPQSDIAGRENHPAVHVSFTDATGRALALVYLYKRGTFFPFAPVAAGGRQRDNLLELQVRDLLAGEIAVEKDLTKWLALWGAPGL